MVVSAGDVESFVVSVSDRVDVSTVVVLAPGSVDTDVDGVGVVTPVVFDREGFIV